MPKAPVSISRRVKVTVDARDAGVCRRCGREVGDVFSRQHRIPRGAGGSAVVDRVSNLVTVCGSATSASGCHNWMENEHRADAERLGWILPKLNPDIDPATEPLFTIDGWVLLTDDGQIVPCGPPRHLEGQ